MRDEVLDQVFRHVVAGQRHQRLALAVEGVDAHHVRAEGFPDLAGDRSHHVLGRIRLRERAPDREQRGGLAQSLLHLIVETGVGERQRQLARDRHREIHLPGLERGRPLGVVDDHDADDLVLPDQRHRHRRLDPEGLHPGGGRQIAHRDVRHDHRAARLDGAQVKRRVRRQRRGEAPIALP